MLVIRDPATRADVEQNVLSFCLKVEHDMDDDLDEHLIAATDANHTEIVRFRIREILARDTYINSAADYYGIALKVRIKDLTISEVDLVQFKNKLSEFENWRACHAGAVGSRPVYNKKHVKKKGRITWTYLCQCQDSKQNRKDRKPEGKSGKIRGVQQSTIKSHCPARVLATEEFGRRKDMEATLSAMKWLEEIEGKGGFTFYNRVDTAKGVFYGFATEWQLRQLRNHGQSLCFDGTHNVPKTNLFTLVLKNKHHGFGVPVAFLLTRSNNSTNVLYPCYGMTPTGEPTPAREYNYTPNAVITDQGNTEILAIKTAFPAYLSSTVRLDLRAILYERDRAVAMRLIAQLRVMWKRHKKLLKYFNKNYFGRDLLVNQNDVDQEEDDVSSSDDSADDDVLEDEGPTSATPVPVGPAAVAVAEGPTVIAVDGVPLTPQQLHEQAIAREQERWMFCYRQELSYTSVDTNNHIES
ncbi:hypothetical protein EC957_006201 [Mortierella hygrophila]|uniref:Uncharacterized protein n=1 Tax=Mortierella hygrophila TaxID=979708 RepID=A0A9P6F009_9FUNG|nr:hypothetical protein EC957_006201 [Mortierella hygrophila]